MRRQPVHSGPGRTLWAVSAFLVGFFVLLLAISHYCLIPAWQVLHLATPTEKQQLSAVFSLLLAVVLFALFVGLMLTFRIGRFFFPRQSPPRARTPYIDAWGEAGRRMETPPKDEE